MSKKQKVVIFLGLCCLVASINGKCNIIKHIKTVKKSLSLLPMGKETFRRVLNKFSDWSLKQKQGSLNGFKQSG